MRNRIQEIKAKGFKMNFSEEVQKDTFIPIDFSKIKVGAQTLDDAILDVGQLKNVDSRLGDKKEVLRAIHNCDYGTMRDISNFFYKTSGIYNRLCRYMAYMYRYDWMVTPYVNSESVKDEKILDTFHKVLNYLDNFEIKRYLPRDTKIWTQMYAKYQNMLTK